MSYFYKVDVLVTPLEGKLISWKMESTFKPSVNIDFFVDRARSGGEWVNIAGPIANACFYLDPTQTDWAVERNTFYRVRFNLDNKWIYSQPVQAGMDLEDSDWALLRELCRKEYLYYKKMGWRGYLLKRKEWGVPCPVCLDFDIRESVNSQCTRCFGTAIDGGYYFKIPMTVVLADTPTKNKNVFDALGTMDLQIVMVRGIYYPLITTKDIWISAKTGDRFEIGKIKILTYIKEVPVIAAYEFKALPRTNITYSEMLVPKIVNEPAEQPVGTEHTWYSKLDC